MPRLMHTMIRVADLGRSIKFYTQHLGFTFLRKCDFPEDRFTLAFLGFGSERDSAVLELTYNYPDEKTGALAKYNVGSEGQGYGHICLGVDCVPTVCRKLKEAGDVKITYESEDAFMAFLVDPDGYEIELLNNERMCKQAEEDYEKQGTKAKIAALRASVAAEQQAAAVGAAGAESN